MPRKSKKLIEASDCDITASVFSNKDDECIQISEEVKYDHLTYHSENKIMDSNAIDKTDVKAECNLVQKQVPNLNINPNLIYNKKNPFVKIIRLPDEILFQNYVLSSTKNLCEKSESGDEILKVTKKCITSKLRKKVQPAKNKSKKKITNKKKNISRSVPKTKENSNKRKFVSENYSEKASKKKCILFNCDAGETSQSFIENSNTSKQSAKEISDIKLDTILDSVKSKVKDPETLKLLAKISMNELSSVIKSGAKYQNRCGREIFTVDDFEKGLLFCEKKSIPAFRYMPTKNNKKETGDIRKALKTAPKVEEECDLPHPEPLVTDVFLKDNQPELPDEFQVYLETVTKMSLNPESRLILLKNLNTNKNISYILLSFKKFLHSEIMSCSDVSRIPNVLNIMQSIVLSPFLYFCTGPYLYAFAYLLLQCIVNTSQYFHLNCDIQSIIDTAVKLLAFVLKKSNSKKLWCEIVFILEAAFCDLTHPFVIHYGAIAAINSIGVTAITLAILPHIKLYFDHLNSIDSFEYQKRYEAYAVRDQLMRTYNLLVSYFKKHDVNKPFYSDLSQNYLDNVPKINISKAFAFSNPHFSEYFGEALVPLFPLKCWVPYCIADDEKQIHKTMPNSKNTAANFKVAHEKKISDAMLDPKSTAAKYKVAHKKKIPKPMLDSKNTAVKFKNQKLHSFNACNTKPVCQLKYVL